MVRIACQKRINFIRRAINPASFGSGYPEGEHVRPSDEMKRVVDAFKGTTGCRGGGRGGESRELV